MNKAGFATVNPSTGVEIEAFSYFTAAQTEKVVARADKSFQSFRELAVHKRAQLFTELGELGGSDAFIVCEDADIPKAVAAGIRGRFGIGKLTSDRRVHMLR